MKEKARFVDLVPSENSLGTMNTKNRLTDKTFVAYNRAFCTAWYREVTKEQDNNIEQTWNVELKQTRIWDEGI